MPVNYKTLFKYSRYIKPFTKYFLLAIALMLLMSVFNLVFPLFTRLIIDEVIINKDTKLLLWVFIGMMGVKLVLGFLTMTRTYLLKTLGNKISLEMKFDFIDHIIHLPFSFFDSKRIGEVASRISDSATIQSMISSVFLNLGTDSISFIVFFVVLYIMNWKIGLALTLTVPLYIINTKAFAPYHRKTSQKFWEKNSKINSETYELLSGVRAVKTFALEKRFLRKIKYYTMDAMKLGMEQTIVGNIQYILTDFSGAIGTFISYFIGGYLVINGEISLGTLIAIISIIPSIYSPLSRLVNMNDQIQGAFKAAERFDSVWAIPKEKESFDEKEKYDMNGKLEFRNLSFAYIGENYVLKDISFKVKKGETLAFVGKSGSGKTTITSLIPGFYTAQRGEILIDGREIYKMNLKHFRRQIGFVHQEPYLFSGSVRDNLSMGLPLFSEEQIIEAAKLANAFEFIEHLPQGFDTEVGERGVRLSGGQKQRLAIARVVLMNPKILILDEPTSALDMESEKLIQDALERVNKDRTTLIIAHRLSTIRNADKIIVLEEGRIVETGTHDVLIEKGGYYANLHNLMGRL